MERIALQAEFLHIHELENPWSEDCSVAGSTLVGFSPFLFCFLAEDWLLAVDETFLKSGFLMILLPNFTTSDILLFEEAELFFSLWKQVRRSSFLGPDFRNSCRSSGLLEASSEWPCFSGVLCTLEERLCMPETGRKSSNSTWQEPKCSQIYTHPSYSSNHQCVCGWFDSSTDVITVSCLKGNLKFFSKVFIF